MKVLLLLRHADSGDKLQGQTDKERGLTNKGIRQANSVAAYMKEKAQVPDLIIASDAARVQATVDIVTRELKLASAVTYVAKLYEADTAGYLDVVRTAPDCQVLLLAGHNPGISTFASFICKTNIDGAGTANVLVFHFEDDSWSNMNKSGCELIEHFVPLP